ncbi:MAG: hypothetical protein R3343_09620 [Nitriliruptorales bacterium]|nr:hypothetical protein [Nitriliruptorales bacterium]
MTAITRRTAAILVAGALVVTAAIAGAARLIDSRTIVDEAPLHLETLSVDAVIVGDLEAPMPDTKFKSNTRYALEVVALPFARSTHYYLGSGAVERTDIPKVGDRVEVSFPPELELQTKTQYAVAIGRPYFEDDAQQQEWPWQAKYVLNLQQDDFVPGTPDSLREDLQLIAEAGETPLQTIVAYQRERAPRVSADGEPIDEPSYGDREARLMAARRASTVDHEHATDAPPERRQLPQQLADAPPGLAAEFGLSELAPWEVAVAYDAVAVGKWSWVALYIEGAGFIGPYLLAPDQAVTSLDGYGPPTGAIELMLWPAGHTPAEIMPDDPEAVAAERLRLSRLDSIGASERARLDAGGAIVVDLRGGATQAYVASSAETDSLYEQLADRGTPSTEGD